MPERRFLLRVTAFSLLVAAAVIGVTLGSISAARKKTLSDQEAACRLFGLTWERGMEALLDEAVAGASAVALGMGSHLTLAPNGSTVLIEDIYRSLNGITATSSLSSAQTPWWETTVIRALWDYSFDYYVTSSEDSDGLLWFLSESDIIRIGSPSTPVVNQLIGKTFQRSEITSAIHNNQFLALLLNVTVPTTWTPSALPNVVIDPLGAHRQPVVIGWVGVGLPFPHLSNYTLNIESATREFGTTLEWCISIQSVIDDQPIVVANNSYFRTAEEHISERPKHFPLLLQHLTDDLQIVLHVSPAAGWSSGPTKLESAITVIIALIGAALLTMSASTVFAFYSKSSDATSGGLNTMIPILPPVSIAFVSIAERGQLWRAAPEAMSVAVKRFKDIVMKAVAEDSCCQGLVMDGNTFQILASTSEVAFKLARRIESDCRAEIWDDKLIRSLSNTDASTLPIRIMLQWVGDAIATYDSVKNRYLFRGSEIDLAATLMTCGFPVPSTEARIFLTRHFYETLPENYALVRTIVVDLATAYTKAALTAKNNPVNKDLKPTGIRLFYVYNPSAVEARGRTSLDANASKDKSSSSRSTGVILRSTQSGGEMMQQPSKSSAANPLGSKPAVVEVPDDAYVPVQVLRDSRTGVPLNGERATPTADSKSAPTSKLQTKRPQYESSRTDLLLMMALYQANYSAGDPGPPPTAVESLQVALVSTYNSYSYLLAGLPLEDRESMLRQITGAYGLSTDAGLHRLAVHVVSAGGANLALTGAKARRATRVIPN
jgi:hypothetical protein